jgi:hypothetical protein
MVRATKSAVNEVYLDDDGVIHGIYHGSQTGAGLQDMMERIMRIMDIMIRNDKPVRLLIDIRDMGEFDPAARLVEMHARTVLPFWKMAFVTSHQHPEQEQVSRKLTLMSGRRKEIRYFEREDDAVGWLSFI